MWDEDDDDTDAFEGFDPWKLSDNTHWEPAGLPDQPGLCLGQHVDDTSW